LTDLSTLQRLDEALDALLLPYTFDLSIYHWLQQEDLREHIRRVGISFYRRPAA